MYWIFKIVIPPIYKEEAISTNIDANFMSYSQENTITIDNFKAGLLPNLRIEDGVLDLDAEKEDCETESSEELDCAIALQIVVDFW